ncbi:12984_t:CDS:2, partial [Racocetra fulgida]
PGAGKSTLANMLIQEDLCSKNLFPMSDSAAGGNSEIVFSNTDVFAIYDTIGLKYFGNHEIIAVDFPFNNDYDADIQQKKRKKNAALLTHKLLSLRYECVQLDIHGSKDFESKVKDVVEFVPVIGTAYKLISAGTYYTLNKPQLAKQRFKEALEDLPKIFSKIAISY